MFMQLKLLVAKLPIYLHWLWWPACLHEYYLNTRSFDASRSVDNLCYTCPVIIYIPCYTHGDVFHIFIKCLGYSSANKTGLKNNLKNLPVWKSCLPVFVCSVNFPWWFCYSFLFSRDRLLQKSCCTKFCFWFCYSFLLFSFWLFLIFSRDRLLQESCRTQTFFFFVCVCVCIKKKKSFSLSFQKTFCYEKITLVPSGTIGRSCHKYNFCQKYASRNKTFVATKIFCRDKTNICHDKHIAYFCDTKVSLSRQNYVCCNRSFVATSILLSRQKTCFVMIKMIPVAAPANK